MVGLAFSVPKRQPGTRIRDGARDKADCGCCGYAPLPASCPFQFVRTRGFRVRVRGKEPDRQTSLDSGSVPLAYNAPIASADPSVCDSTFVCRPKFTGSRPRYRISINSLIPFVHRRNRIVIESQFGESASTIEKQPLRSCNNDLCDRPRPA